ncbi:hypothetical protein MKW98_018630 [Papaver atlanticum]|uniref:Thioester reductase (TE) domain-containing protein n=1 Tax=Papaver atlanticum TaxID=357466 RepID=A0AAD4T515_9MAGN|nr:hypothetical protein MKW98_018630 [Papaver atlanticum]
MKEIVCVTGAGGFLASWVVKYLLAEGFIVRATVRNPSNFLYCLLVELIEPALIGTRKVLKACTEAKVKRVVVVSSIAAVMLNPNWPKGKPMNELCWSENEYCKTSENWYCLSKTEAESEAWEYTKKKGHGVVTVCPALIIGPMLQSTITASSSILKGTLLTR